VRVLVLNAGSSSLKAEFLDAHADGSRGEKWFEVLFERIGEGTDGHPDHGAAVAELLRKLEETGEHPDAVGHRVVHGGDRFTQPAVLDDETVAAIEDVVPLAPLHNPANLAGIAAARAAFPDVPHVAVFDTAFHATLPPAAHRYAVPQSWYAEHGVRRYGFHGISHSYVAGRAAGMLGRPLEELRIITAHLGNGASVCAIERGRSVDTSMGLGPLAGLVMGTRSGDVDPTVLFHMVEHAGMDFVDVVRDLNRASGLRGMAGSNDLRDIERAAGEGDQRAILALQVMVHRLVGYIGAYAVRMGGLDALVFTAGIGERSVLVRARTCARLQLLGIRLDANANAGVHGEARIDINGGGPAVFVVPTDEEGEIARQVAEVVGDLTPPRGPGAGPR